MIELTLFHKHFCIIAYFKYNKNNGNFRTL